MRSLGRRKRIRGIFCTDPSQRHTVIGPQTEEQSHVQPHNFLILKCFRKHPYADPIPAHFYVTPPPV
ncbi:hypothetical protein XELAEV_18001676mg [Xenopus laevis]|uniref:Uncharacterized protein n=1 Tax=Xenopus laevis TaxID=8355 RepID=A0A974BPA5_XENLA|nr:hypothetical protein XELAEV_18001676mg [Xenopus laevis]